MIEINAEYRTKINKHDTRIDEIDNHLAEILELNSKITIQMIMTAISNKPDKVGQALQDNDKRSCGPQQRVANCIHCS